MHGRLIRANTVERFRIIMGWWGVEETLPIAGERGIAYDWEAPWPFIRRPVVVWLQGEYDMNLELDESRSETGPLPLVSRLGYFDDR